MPARTPRDTYHHGNLRNVLLAASLQLIEQEGISAVSLRRVAREAGVSTGAPYHHFADRAALLSALAIQGFEKLERSLSTAREQAQDPKDALAALVRAYVLFAVERRPYFLLMFRPELSQPEKHPDLRDAGDRAYRVLSEVAGECIQARAVRINDPAIVAATTWGLAHGLASLWLDVDLEEKFDQSPRQLVNDVTSALATLLADGGNS